MYIHFQEKCLRGYDKDTYYEPEERFDYGVVELTKNS